MGEIKTETLKPYNVTTNECIAVNGKIPERIETSE